MSNSKSLRAPWISFCALCGSRRVDIYQVNLTQLASEFIEYVEFMRELDLEVAGEFVVMAATLMYIKEQELLPKTNKLSWKMMKRKRTLGGS